jgi:tetratricopeptide (TPR) repeat protein
LADAGADPARVVHHAEAGGDNELLVTHARIAADRAVAASAHREAWSHLQRVLPLLDHIPASDVAMVLEFASREAYAAGDVTSAHDLAVRSLDLFRAASDAVGRGRLHRWLSRIRWFEGHRFEAEVQARLAVDVLEPLGRSEELAWAYSTLSQLSMLAWHGDEAVRWGERAIEVAAAVGARSALAHAMLNVATARAMTTDDEGPQREAIAVALEAGEHHEVVRGLGVIAYRAMESDRLSRAAEVAREALAHAEIHEVETLRQYVVAMLGRVAFLEGRWEEADELLGEIAQSPLVVNRILALRTLAQLQLRRGDPEAARTITEGRRLADQVGEPQRTLPMLQIEAEQAWFEDRLVDVVHRLVEALEPARWLPAHLGRIARWLQEAGSLDEIPTGIPEPHLAELEGRWGDAADEWRERGMPYEEALALARTGDDGVVEARAIAERLGAAPLLRRLGADGCDRV